MYLQVILNSATKNVIMEIVTEDLKFFKSLNRATLENIAIQVSRMNYYKLVNIVGVEVCYLQTTADKILLKKVYSNIQKAEGYCSVPTLMLQLEERGYYSRIVEMGSVEIAEL